MVGSKGYNCLYESQTPEGGYEKILWKMYMIHAFLRLFYFCIFQKTNYRNIFLVLDFTVLYSYRPAGGGRDLYVNKYNFFAQRFLAPCRPTTWRQAPASNIKFRHFPRALIFCPRDPERGEGERRGEGGNSTGEALPDFGSEPQVTNISQLL